MKSFENGEARKMEETFVKVNMILSMVMVRYIYTYVCMSLHPLSSRSSDRVQCLHMLISLHSALVMELA